MGWRAFTADRSSGVERSRSYNNAGLPAGCSSLRNGPVSEQSEHSSSAAEAQLARAGSTGERNPAEGLAVGFSLCGRRSSEGLDHPVDDLEGKGVPLGCRMIEGKLFRGPLEHFC